MSTTIEHFSAKARDFNDHGYRPVGLRITPDGAGFEVALLIEHEDDHLAPFPGQPEALPVVSRETEREARDLANAIWRNLGL